MTVQPGWYPDPAEPTTQRYWDGEGWIGAPLPVDATPPPGPPPAEPEPGSPAPAGGTPAGPSTAPGTPPGTPGSPAPPQVLGPGVPPPPVGPGVPPPYGQGLPPHGAPPGPPPGWPPGSPPPPGWWPHWTAPPPRPHGLPLASFGARVVARIIDIGVVFLLNVLVNGWFVWRFVQEVEPVSRELNRWLMSGGTDPATVPQVSRQADWLQVVILLIAVALWFAYEVPSVANTGQTLGKRLVGIKVVPVLETEQVSFGRSFRRWNMLGLPVFLWSCCGIGFLIQLLDCGLSLVDRPLQQTLHDKRAQTVVVQLPRRTTTHAGAAGPTTPTTTPPGSPAGPTTPTAPSGSPGSPAGNADTPTDRSGGTES